MFYVYGLESLSFPERRYIGQTDNLRRRLAEHNARKWGHTAKFAPWKLKFYLAFETVGQSRKFEKYLKSGSGHTFAKRHLWN